MVAIGSPASTTAPRVTGTVSTRPSPGATTVTLGLLLHHDLALGLGSQQAGCG